MGASDWFYVQPVRRSPEAALDRLREHVFSSREYFAAGPPEEVAAETSEIMEDAELVGRDLDPLARWSPKSTMPSRPRSRAGAPPWAGLDSTHSILDMVNGISATPGYGCVSPITDGELRRLFGTATPSLRDIERRQESVCGLRGKWEGVYLYAYSRRSKPKAIVFAGWSGD